MAAGVRPARWIEDWDGVKKRLEHNNIAADMQILASRIFPCGRGLILGLRSAILRTRFAAQAGNDLLGVIIMEWTAPAFEEVCLNCEINSYASAKL